MSLDSVGCSLASENILRVSRDITKCQEFLHDVHDGAENNAMAIAIPQVFSENSQAKKALFWERVENIVEKGKNGNQHFLLFPQRFQKATFSGSLKVGIVW